MRKLVLTTGTIAAVGVIGIIMAIIVVGVVKQDLNDIAYATWIMLP